MIRKYRRGQAPLDPRRPPYQRLNPAATAPIRRRLFLIYAGIFLALTLAYFWHGLAQAIQFAGQPVVRGIGTVIVREERRGAPQGRYWIRLEVEAGGRRLHSWTPVEEETHARLAVGDRLGVHYRVSRSGGAIRIEQTGLFAVDAPVR